MTLRKIPIYILALLLLLSLSACGDSDYEDTPSPPPTETGQVDIDQPDTPGTGSDGIQNPPDYPDIELLAEGAYLTSDEYMVLEPDSPPYNIGGWTGYGSAIWFDVDIPADGLYEIGLYYSRAYTDRTIEGTLQYQHGTDDIVEITFDVSDPTSDEPGDWSVYTYKAIAECEMVAGLHTIGMFPGTGGQGMDPGEHFINLRSVMLTALERYDDGGEVGGGVVDVVDTGDFGSLTHEQRMRMLKYDIFDMNNPQSEFPPETVYAFYAQYANDEYGLSLTAEDVERAIEETSVEGSFEYPRFMLVCVEYELYPSQELRESSGFFDYIEPLQYGDDPIRAWSDTDEIPAEYFE